MLLSYELTRMNYSYWKKYHYMYHCECGLKVIKTSLWKAFLFICGQEPMLFSTTIAENIRYGTVDVSAVTDDQVWEAARMANAEVFIRQFPKGLSTLVGERGIMLSGTDTALNVSFFTSQ